jgi:hypothetical protein
MLQVVENQHKSNDPPETRQAVQRLIDEGIGESDAKIYIAQCISVEIFNVMKYGEAFNQQRFVKNLQNLPKEPFDK